jgi:Holliday junction resolvase RusA-like endonuclease
MKVLSFFVEGRPVPKGRPRVLRRLLPNGRWLTKTVTPKRTVAWEKVVQLVAQANCSRLGWEPEATPHEVDIVVHRAARRGDADNFGKAVLDALNGVVWTDDSHVRRVSIELVDGQGAGVAVTVRRAA